MTLNVAVIVIMTMIMTVAVIVAVAMTMIVIFLLFFSFTHSHTLSFTPFSHLLIHPFSHPLIHPFSHPLIHPFLFSPGDWCCSGQHQQGESVRGIPSQSSHPRSTQQKRSKVGDIYPLDRDDLTPSLILTLPLTPQPQF